MDDGSRLPLILAIVFLLLAAVFFAVAETAFSCVVKTKIKTSMDKGVRGARKAQYVLDHFELAISSILIGTNIVHISIATIVTVAVTRRWGVSAVSVSTIITTIVVFFAGEMLPKSIARKYSYSCAFFCAAPLCFFMKIFYPVSVVLSTIGHGAASLVKGDDPVSVTEDELYDIIEDMTQEGTLDEEQGNLISSALQFGDVTAESVLTPRVDVTAIDINSSREEIMKLIQETNHSRLPVYEGSIDNIIGILQIRRYIKAYLQTEGEIDLRSLLDEAYFVHQSTNIDELLPVMSEKRLNMAIVTDSYGGTVGIITVEDIVEELVGEIWDEDDVVKEPIIRLSETSIEADADLHVSDVFDYLDYEDPMEDEDLNDTRLGEWAYSKFPEIPGTGDSFDYHGLHVIITDMEHNRIRKLVITREKKEDKEEQSG